MTVQEKEAIETIINTPTVMSPAEEAAFDKECAEFYEETYDGLYEGDTSWMHVPTQHYTKCVTGYTKNNILLDAWNRYVREQEELSIRLGMKPSELLGEQKRYQQAVGFSHWFLAYMEGMAASFENNEE